MESNMILKSILREFKSQGYTQVAGYKRFGYVSETPSAIIVSRETGKDTRIPFKKLLQGIEAVKKDPDIYDNGPSGLRAFGITHINSPIWSLIHLMPKSEY